MIIHEIFIQGIEGLTQQLGARPVRVSENSTDPFSQAVALEPDIKAEWIYKCIRLLLYPTHTSQRGEELFAKGNDPRAGVILSHNNLNVRCMRGASPESIMLQFDKEIAGGQRVWETVANGIEQVEHLLSTRIARPSFESFDSLCNWCDPDSFYKPNEAEAAIEDAIDNDLSINSLMLMYENAYSYEQAQVKVGRLSEKLTRASAGTGPHSVGQTDPQIAINGRQKVALEEAINEIVVEIANLGLGDISQSEFEKVLEAESTIVTSARELRRLEEVMAQLRVELCSVTVKPWMSNPLFWLSFLLAIGCIVAAFFINPLIVFASLIFIVWSMSILFKSTAVIGNQSTCYRKLERAESRYETEANAYAAAQQKVRHFNIAVDTLNLNEVSSLFKRRQRLIQELIKRQMELQEFLDTVGPNGLPVGEVETTKRNPNATLIGELEIARGMLESSEKPAYSAKTLAREMMKHGVDPTQFSSDLETEMEGLRAQESLLIAQAELAGCMYNGSLVSDVEVIWNHLLHRFMHANLYFCITDSKVEISTEKSTKASSPTWKEDRPNVLRWVLFALNCALIEYSARGTHEVPLARNIFCLHPDSLKREDDRRRLKRIVTGTEALFWFFIRPAEEV